MRMSASSEFVVYCGSGVGNEAFPWMQNAGLVGTPGKHPLMINTWSDLRLNLPTCMYDMPMASIIDRLHCQQSINALQSVILVVGVMLTWLWVLESWHLSLRFCSNCFGLNG